jgi:8-oxo-dGTP pyrophosphatase MutT (NUDIX family)
MSEKPSYYYNQSAVIPYFREEDNWQVILITTRKRKWTIPKGIVEPELTPLESAEKEAEEEAGVRGISHSEVFDTFQYQKWGGTCFVVVYLMEVREILEEWPEKYFRERAFFTPVEAISAIGREEIKRVLERFHKII